MSPIACAPRPFDNCVELHIHNEKGGAPRLGSFLQMSRWATSLSQALRERATGLRLRNSKELICHNYMCEKVGETCLCQLSMVLSRMRDLRHLDLSSNRLSQLPEVWLLPQLESLDVSENRLTTLPEQLATMPSLQRIRLEGNPIEHIPPQLQRLIVTGCAAALEDERHGDTS